MTANFFSRLLRRTWPWSLGGLLVIGCASPDADQALFEQRYPSVAHFFRPPDTSSSETTARAEPTRKPLPKKSDTDAAIQQVQHVEEAPAPSTLPLNDRPPVERFPLDLAAALGLAGANNLQIALAAERVRQAQARLQGADVLWIPTLNAGVGYNRHDGQIQDTRGDVLDVKRSSLFVGGGPKVGYDALNGGNNGPSRLALGLPLTDAIFAPLAERQLVQAAQAVRASTFNDTLLQVALVYMDLVRAQGQVDVTREAEKNAQELVRLVETRVRAGTAPPADELRARAEFAERRRQVFEAEETLHVVSAELVRLLRLDQAIAVFPVDSQPMSIDMINLDLSLPALIAQGLSNRPELAENRAQLNATLARLRQEHWRPAIPNLQLGLSSGGFGGGTGSFFGDFNDRTDFDALVVWELRNLGFGNRALQRERASQNLQASLNAAQMSDIIAAEVARAYYQVHYRRQQVAAAQDQVKAAAEAVPLNFKGILGGQLRAIEAQQAIQTLASARNQYLISLTDYNRSQFQLLRALGQSPEAPGQVP